tara:strand:+ start:391 stop:621 length:231 start_codon:yes stop_codon:yes gene_type:complete
MRIDLHGYYVHNGWQYFNQQVTEAYFRGYKKCHVITGQGIMMREFETWASNHPYIKECIQNPRNLGSFNIKLKKKG